MNVCNVICREVNLSKQSFRNVLHAVGLRDEDEHRLFDSIMWSVQIIVFEHLYKHLNYFQRLQMEYLMAELEGCVCGKADHQC